MKTTTFENAKVGDKVWCMVSGWGVVGSISESNPHHHLVVVFDNGVSDYTKRGAYDINCKQTLFWDEIKFDAPTAPLPKLKVDDKVLVWWEGDEFRYKRYFSHFSDGKIYCFKDGATSFSADRTLVTAWDNFEIYTGE